MLSKLKFIGKVLSNTITGRQRFSLKYLYKCKLKHISVTLTKDDFILLNFRKRNESLIFDFFSFKTDDPLVPKKKKKEIIERSRDELPIAEKEIDHKKKVSKSFLANEEIEIKKTYFYVV